MPATASLPQRFMATQQRRSTLPISYPRLERNNPFNIHTISDVQSLYRSDYLGGQLTTVDGKPLRRFVLNGESAITLGRQNVGIFLQSRGSLTRLALRLKKLGQRECGGRWVIVASSKKNNCTLRHLYNGGSDWEIPEKHDSTVWHDGSLTFCTPETLRAEILPEGSFPIGILMIDGFCCVHRHRFGYVDRQGRPQNRAGKIADYRARHAVEDWLPPLVLFTQKAPNSVERTQIAGSLGLECFRYMTQGISAVKRGPLT